MICALCNDQKGNWIQTSPSADAMSFVYDNPSIQTAALQAIYFQWKSPPYQDGNCIGRWHYGFGNRLVCSFCTKCFDIEEAMKVVIHKIFRKNLYNRELWLRVKFWGLSKKGSFHTKVKCLAKMQTKASQPRLKKVMLYSWLDIVVNENVSLWITKRPLILTHLWAYFCHAVASISVQQHRHLYPEKPCYYCSQAKSWHRKFTSIVGSLCSFF